VGDAGSPFRQGGDEFAILLHGEYSTADTLIAAASAALAATGEGFSITSSHGSVALPREAEAPTAALRLADTRMYADKGDHRRTTRRQTSDVLLGLLRERRPDIHEHVCQVGRLALLVGRQLRMSADQLDELHRAAELHDIGKAAIPDVILNKAGRLTEAEWEFICRHTIVGERILTLAPALAPTAILVRSTHERWDGKGYPDRLAGTSIPLGSRIIAVCDAFDAMTSERAHRAARSPAAALTELQHAAGTQFDPDVVQALSNAWEREGSRDSAAASGSVAA
jgi:HD-GYP domain-containing protein (c-di-GMP phosphodiesterase class II)